MTDLASVWHQMRSHAHQCVDVMTNYARETQSARTSCISVSMANSELDKYTKLMQEFTTRNDDLKLINKRYRYVLPLYGVRYIILYETNGSYNM